MPQPAFPYGASYSPLIFAESEWDADLAAMQRAGMNLVRIGDVHGSWDRIEPRPGELRLDILGRFYAAAYKRGVGVLLCTGASSPPLWLARQYPDVSILSSRGERYPLGASYHWACIHHPGFRQAAGAYLRSLAGFAVRQPNHFGWQISNEIGFPFMPAREKGDLGLYCYCPHCQEGFRTWLKERYVSLEALTEAWSWSTTNFVYNDWQDASAPESLPASWSGVTRWLDWRLFWQQAFARFAGWQQATLRSIDVSHPTSVNTFNFKGFDRFGTYMGLDQWQIAAQVDHIGYDLYPGSGDKLKSRPEHNSIFLDHGRSVALSTGRDFWIHEAESGPIGGWLLGPEHDTNVQDVLNNAIECLGHNAKLLLYMPWREWGYQPLRWGALVELDGAPTPRLQAAGELGAFIQQNAGFLLQAQPPRSEIAILESKPNAIFLRGVEQEETLFAAQRGVYRAFWEQGFGVDFVDVSLLSLERLAQYRVVCLPLLGLLSREQAEILQAYTAGGGLLVGFARAASLDEKGWYHLRLPIPAMARAFGLDSVRAATLDGQAIQYNGQVYPAHLNRDELGVLPGCEVLARFGDGLPAVTLSTCGAGHGLYIATQADSGYGLERSNLLPDVAAQVCARLEITPALVVESSPGRARGIDTHLLESRHRSLVLCSNYARPPITARIHLALKGRRPVSASLLFPRSQPLAHDLSAEIIHFETEFTSEEVQIIEIIWE